MRICYAINNFHGNCLQSICCKRKICEDILTLASKQEPVMMSVTHLFYKIKWYLIWWPYEIENTHTLGRECVRI